MVEERQTQDVKIVALMSVPMVGWNPHWGATSEALHPFGIPIRLCYGAWWDHGMSNLLEECVAEGLDWVLTIDYDSMFTSTHVNHLIARFGQRPDIDALAALQCKRGTEEVPLLTVHGASGVSLTGEPFKVNTAHFGLTLIRVEALKRMPKPWFVNQPDPNGSYNTLGRVDADIYFWKKWEATRNTVFVDPVCSIGHLQPMVAEYDEYMKVRHTHITDWRGLNQR